MGRGNHDSKDILYGQFKRLSGKKPAAKLTPAETYDTQQWFQGIDGWSGTDKWLVNNPTISGKCISKGSRAIDDLSDYSAKTQEHFANVTGDNFWPGLIAMNLEAVDYDDPSLYRVVRQQGKTTFNCHVRRAHVEIVEELIGPGQWLVSAAGQEIIYIARENNLPDMPTLASAVVQGFSEFISWQ